MEKDRSCKFQPKQSWFFYPTMNQSAYQSLLGGKEEHFPCEKRPASQEDIIMNRKNRGIHDGNWDTAADCVGSVNQGLCSDAGDMLH
jgi:hypothetical protein